MIFIQFPPLKLFLSFIISACLFVSTFSMEEAETPLTLFQNSPKYLVHIGFPYGLPENGIMRPGSCHAVNYFSLNGTLPSNDHMPRLDTDPYVVILKLTDSIMKWVIGFHVTEVLLAGEIDLKAEECSILAPQGAKIPQALVDKVVYYEGNNLVNRNQRVWEHLESLGAYPICLEEKRDHSDQRTWDNWTTANATINGTTVNVNLNGNPDYFFNILEVLPGISYTCPACYTFDTNTPGSSVSGINHLSKLREEITNKNAAGINFHQSQLIDWVNSLAYLDPTAREDFVSRIQNLNLPVNNHEDWVASTLGDIGDKCIVS